MKSNDLVECINDAFKIESSKWIQNFPKKGNYYTIRDVIDHGKQGIGVLLEEISNPILPHSGIEPTFAIKRFANINTPDYISEFLEEVTLIPLYL
jgi:hypothetical protein